MLVDRLGPDRARVLEAHLYPHRSVSCAGNSRRRSAPQGADHALPDKVCVIPTGAAFFLPRSGGINAKRFILLGPHQANRCALIPPLRSLTLAPVEMTQKIAAKNVETREGGRPLAGAPLHRVRS